MKKNIFVFCLSCLFCLQSPAIQIDSGVIVNDLPSFSLNTLGTHTKLPTNLWQTSDKNELYSLIDKIGTTNLSPASTNAFITLLTQDSTGFEKKSQDEETNANLFLIKRLNALVRLGAFDEAINLIELVPAQKINSEILLIKTNVLLAQGKFDEAQKTIEELPPSFETDQLRINLFLEKEEKDKAILSYEIYRENEEQPDALFTSIAENVLLELDAKIDETSTLKNTHVFLLSRLKETPFDLYNQTNGIRKTFIQLPSNSIDNRIFYAEKTVLTSDELSQIYRLPLLDLKRDKNHLKRAELYQQTTNETDSFKKADLLNKFIQLVQLDKLLLFEAPLIEKELNKITAQPQFKKMAFAAAQVYILQNNLEKANEWYQILANDPADIHQKQRLLLTIGMQWLGAARPIETESLFQHFCQNKKDKDCDEYVIKTQNIIQQTETTSPLTAIDNKDKIGENLIRALFMLNDELAINKMDIIRFIEQNYPREIYLPLALEESIFQ